MAFTVNDVEIIFAPEDRAYRDAGSAAPDAEKVPARQTQCRPQIV